MMRHQQVIFMAICTQRFAFLLTKNLMSPSVYKPVCSMQIRVSVTVALWLLSSDTRTALLTQRFGKLVYETAKDLKASSKVVED